ncbi:uncharacterized protein LOC125576362 [Brassica napus]|uniref:uncharacterized protein LOC125576362 n=1 Tax=Brassica napus TaxID=3708 RepID=UPI0020785CCC|nr:uncharacterized protein LOC125576362 [Brassica napus]
MRNYLSGTKSDLVKAQEQTEEISVASLQDLLTFRCPPVSSVSLVSPVTAQEIYEALLSLPNDKVSGPDGFTKEFYVAAWKVIGQDFITAIQSFFLFGFLPSGINATILSLIPKTENAEKMKDFRPIACCNLLYKVISKVLANRLRIIFPDAIEPNQSAFITGRLLLENVLLASELVNGYHKSAATQRSAIKFDISKAFDTVKWSFITSVLKAMGLPVQFVHWIGLCISTAAFSISVNGSLEGFFTSARGIRQGCSLSPYLYVILSNVLSKLLNKAAAAGEFQYHPHCQGVELTHLSFADDIVVFTDGSVDSLRGVMEVMSDFAAMSGLHINASKSTIFAAGPALDTLLEEATAMGISAGTLPVRYLGLPLTTKSLTPIDYEPLIDKHSFCQPSASILLKVCAALFFSLDLPTKHIRRRLAGQNYVIPKKRVGSSFWDVRDTQKGSWMWRKLLKLRDTAYNFLKFEVKDGKSTYFWFDNWLDKGRLIDITGAAGTTYIGLPWRATVSEAVKQNEWALRGQQSRHYHDLHAAIIAEPVPDAQYGRDVVLWKAGDDDYHENFSSKKTWDQIRVKKGPVGWSKGCTLCGEVDETRDHLFFACPYSYTVWHGLANRIMGSHTDPDWQLTLDYMEGFRDGSMDTILIKMLFQTTIYHIWRERNARRHHTSWMTAEAMSKTVDKAIRNRISSLKYKAGHKLEGLMRRWFTHTM